jgi:hypothetical protein
MTAPGSADPQADGLLVYAEGVIFYALAGAGTAPMMDELRRDLTGFLTGLLRGRPVG